MARKSADRRILADFGKGSEAADEPPGAGLDRVGSPYCSFVADRQLVAAPGAASSEHSPSILGLHALTKPMFLGALSIVRLKCTFGHFLESTRRAKAHP